MTTDVDITNRALQLIGTRTTITALTEQSNEAIQANLVYTAVRDWCFGISAWSFARKTATLISSKTVTTPVGTWNSSLDPSPPWIKEYRLPTDFIRAIYVTDSNHASSTNYDGNPERFVISNNTVVATQQRVLLTNANGAILIYIGQVTDPSIWPWYFERFIVSSLAWTLSMSLTGDKDLTAYLDNVASRFFVIAEQLNRQEGLLIPDTTPEWIQALGINYPYRRGMGEITNDSNKR